MDQRDMYSGNLGATPGWRWRRSLLEPPIAEQSTAATSPAVTRAPTIGRSTIRIGGLVAVIPGRKQQGKPTAPTRARSFR